jgi:hypothetical protein
MNASAIRQCTPLLMGLLVGLAASFIEARLQPGPPPLTPHAPVHLLTANVA